VGKAATNGKRSALFPNNPVEEGLYNTKGVCWNDLDQSLVGPWTKVRLHVPPQVFERIEDYQPLRATWWETSVRC